MTDPNEATPVPAGDAPSADPGVTPATAAQESPAQASPGPEDRRGYAFKGAALELGTVMVDGRWTRPPGRIPLAMMNRHGIIAGATGTGKTKTLQAIAEQLSSNGGAGGDGDIRGDLSGCHVRRVQRPDRRARTADRRRLGPRTEPGRVRPAGRGGDRRPHPPPSPSFGPILLSKVLSLNATQESTLGLIFHWADQGSALLDLKRPAGGHRLPHQRRG